MSVLAFLREGFSFVVAFGHRFKGTMTNTRFYLALAVIRVFTSAKKPFVPLPLTGHSYLNRVRLTGAGFSVTAILTRILSSTLRRPSPIPFVPTRK
jgi:hypothetical protein